MDEFVTTYRKDFMWPYVRTYPLRTERRTVQRVYAEPDCVCGSELSGVPPPKEYVGPLEGENVHWSRLGPMGPLLDPKMYPAKVGPAPEFEIMHYDQPNLYLKKLQEKHPYLYNVLQTPPPDELIRRVNEDRLRTTYQVDYGHMDYAPSGEYEKLFMQAGIPCCMKPVCDRDSPKTLDCRAAIRPPSYDDPIEAQGQQVHVLSIESRRIYDNGDRTPGYGYCEYEPDSQGIRDESRYRDIPGEQYREVRDYPGERSREGRDYPGERSREGRDYPGERSREGHDYPGDRSREIRDYPGDKSRDVRDRPGDTSRDVRDRPGDNRHREVPERSREHEIPRENGGRREIPTRENGTRDRDRVNASRPRETGPRGTNGDRNLPQSQYQSPGQPQSQYQSPGQAQVHPQSQYQPEGHTQGQRVHEGRAEGPGTSPGNTEAGRLGGGGFLPKKPADLSGGIGENKGVSRKVQQMMAEAEEAKKPLPAWKSEYQNVIGDIGSDIIRDKMHQHGGRSSGRSCIERIMMKCR